MRNLIRLEELAMFLMSLAGFIYSSVGWWWFFVFLLVPDVSMIGYLLGPRRGALLYNFVHHKGIAIVFMATGYFLDVQVLLLSGVILFGHSSMDRLFGYGLKLSTGFKHTHLGIIGK